MRNYEIMIIWTPDIEVKEVEGKTKEYLKFADKINSTNVIGRKRLAYEIAHHIEGVYIVVEFSADPTKISDLERLLKINDQVLRAKVLKKDK